MRLAIYGSAKAPQAIEKVSAGAGMRLFRWCSLQRPRQEMAKTGQKWVIRVGCKWMAPAMAQSTLDNGRAVCLVASKLIDVVRASVNKAGSTQLLSKLETTVDSACTLAGCVLQDERGAPCRFP
jgi:hypothetical protein